MKKIEKESALVVFSGGQDSTTCLFWAKKHFAFISAVGFDYGQRHKKELDCAAKICKSADIPFTILPLPLLNSITKNALTNPTVYIGESPATTLVEGRNMLFLTYAAIYAKTQNIRHLITGVSETDYSGYPDCRQAFIDSLQKTLRLSMEWDYTIHTPLMKLNKAAVWGLADELGILDIIKLNTLTCYDGIIGEGCEKCAACGLRKKGYEKYLGMKEK